MKALLVLAVTAVALSAVTCRNIQRSAGKLQTLQGDLQYLDININDVVDSVLDLVNTEIQALNLDPYETDLDILDLFNVQGDLVGLSTLARVGDAELDDTGLDVIISAEVGVSNVSGALGIASDLIPELEASAGVSVKDIAIQMKLKLKILSLSLTLEEFQTEDIGEVQVDITGLGPLFDPLVDDIASLIANAVKGLLADVLDVAVKDIVNDVLGYL